MVRNYIIRDELYPEETRLECGISQQTCIMLEYDWVAKEEYATSRQNGILFQEDLLYTNVTIKETDYLMVYVADIELALRLAQRYVDESDKNYSVIGVDSSYSVFD